MKKIEWINGDHMRFESDHKTFNRQADIIMDGNVISHVQYSFYIRSHSETECNGFTNPPGHLQSWDLDQFKKTILACIKEEARKLTHEKGGILYQFHHWRRGRSFSHGVVPTTRDHQLVKRWAVSPSEKSRSVIDEAIKYITEGREDG